MPLDSVFINPMEVAFVWSRDLGMDSIDVLPFLYLVRWKKKKICSMQSSKNQKHHVLRMCLFLFLFYLCFICVTFYFYTRNLQNEINEYISWCICYFKPIATTTNRFSKYLRYLIPDNFVQIYISLLYYHNMLAM